jgi:DNA-binding LacI/PurR family transcriptional regulator
VAREIRSPLLRRFALGTAAGCGERVGEYLLTRGHRRVVFIAPQDSTVPRIRWTGVCRPFKQAGHDGAVVFRSMDVPDWCDPSPTPAFQALRSRLEDAVAWFANQHGTSCSGSDIGETLARLRLLAAKLAFVGRSRAFFDQTLRTYPATAWVAFNDEVAFLAGAYLREARVRLPQQLSLIGFDSTPASSCEGLTSYNFNVPAIVSAMLDHVISPRRTHLRGPVVEIPGMVLERQTSGEAPS